MFRCLVLFVASVFSATSSIAGPPSAAAVVSSQRVLVIAHRGDSKVAPENTIPAFRSAVSAGCDLVELDYVHSADGIPVVLHDNTLDRTTNAVVKWGMRKNRVAHKTLAELRQLDAGTWFGTQFSGVGIPTLEESLNAIQAGSMTLIERKAGDAATCVELLKAKDLVEQVVVQSFDWRYVKACHDLAPNLVLAALGGRQLTEKKLDQIVATGARIVAWHTASMSADAIDAIHRRGLRAWVWTVDDLRRADQLVEHGIDGIISNVPAQIGKLVEDRR